MNLSWRRVFTCLEVSCAKSDLARHHIGRINRTVITLIITDHEKGPARPGQARLRLNASPQKSSKLGSFTALNDPIRPPKQLVGHRSQTTRHLKRSHGFRSSSELSPFRSRSTPNSLGQVTPMYCTLSTPFPCSARVRTPRGATGPDQAGTVRKPRRSRNRSHGAQRVAFSPLDSS